MDCSTFSQNLAREEKSHHHHLSVICVYEVLNVPLWNLSLYTNYISLGPLVHALTSSVWYLSLMC